MSLTEISVTRSCKKRLIDLKYLLEHYAELVFGRNLRLKAISNRVAYKKNWVSHDVYMTLAGGFLTQQRSLRFGSSSFGKDKPSGGRVLFCSNYQKGTCNHSKDHHGNFLGEKQLLRHICAKCWLTSKNMSEHPEMSDKCPLFDQES